MQRDTSCLQRWPPVRSTCFARTCIGDAKRGVRWPPLANERAYQLDLATPISNPWDANSLKDIRESLQNRYTPRLLPLNTHLFLKRVTEPFLFKVFNLWMDWTRVLAGSDRSWIIDLYPMRLSSCFLYSCRRILSFSSWLVIIMFYFKVLQKKWRSEDGKAYVTRLIISTQQLSF